ncbi:uncharacterized protein ASCRUDRAFT_76015 [Ascoidea rubescens DSM 1968]|uniref:Swc3 C-terminal domain-containing protein n=1 Tax=Ascoidea rubescens DSM 1968 TaxID=1344418 RepID=A0A1D2VGL7_9ASCO|nr:hypothetical protein ASCRUDRAFT_76015 [Ascoidea rubescens DSM 1968]ODV60617.1 hypothetical protein ASCRUDRAFT_76015 [Ascoidea rubescens DSM 1968]
MNTNMNMNYINNRNNQNQFIKNKRVEIKPLKVQKSKPAKPVKVKPPKEEKLTSFQERYLNNADLVFEFFENANFRLHLPKDAIVEVIGDSENDQEFKMSFSYLLIVDETSVENFNRMWNDVLEKKNDEKKQLEEKKLQEKRLLEKQSLEKQRLEETNKVKETQKIDPSAGTLTKIDNGEIKTIQENDTGNGKENIGDEDSKLPVIQEADLNENQKLGDETTVKSEVEIKAIPKRARKKRVNRYGKRRKSSRIAQSSKDHQLGQDIYIEEHQLKEERKKKEKLNKEQKEKEAAEKSKKEKIIYTPFTFQVLNIPKRFVPILKNSVNKPEEVKEKMKLIFEKGVRTPKCYLWYQIDGFKDEKLGEELRQKLVHNSLAMAAKIKRGTKN